MFKNLMDNGIDIKKILMVLVVIIMLIVFLIINITPRGYLIVEQSLILTKKGGKWSQIDKLDDDILSKKYSVYSSTGKSENVLLNYSSNNWYYLDKNYADLSLNKVQVAYTKEFNDLKLAQYDSTFYDANDDEYLKNILKEKGIAEFKDSVIKNSYDLDGDGVVEHIYTITNESLDGESSGNYSSIFLVKGDTLIGTLDKDTNTPYMVQSIIDLDGNGKYEVIVSKGTIDMATFDTCYQIYSISGKKIKLIKDC